MIVAMKPEELRQEKRKVSIITAGPGLELSPPLFYIEGDRLFMDFEAKAPVMAGGGPQVPFGVRHNEIYGKPAHWDMNKNDSAMEVVDESGSVVCQMYYKAPHHIVFFGRFPSLGIVTPRPKPLFKYPSWKHPGQLLE